MLCQKVPTMLHTTKTATTAERFTLKKERDFQREMGKSIDVSLFAPLDGEKVITGELKGYDGSSVSVGDKVIPMEKVAKVNLHIDF